MNKLILSLAILLNFISFNVFAQPANNTCAGAISLTVSNGSCSSIDYTNVGATTAGNPATPACWSPNSMSHTVWFSFVAPSTSVQMSTNFPNGPGDMTNTQIAAYSGTCGSLTNIGCSEDINTAGGVTHATLALHGLTVGNTYYIIVDGNGTSTGTFGICVEQILPVGAPQPINDCPTGQFLCNKNSVSIPNGTGSPGTIQEMPTCFGSPGERASSWYTFTVGTSGTLCFDITPTAAVDYDWAFFNTTNGCMGTQMACNWSPNLGGTGVTGANGAAGAQNAGCINVVAGQTYSILVDRFTATSSAGYTLSFGGTATFASPNPTFTSTTTCVGQATQFTNTTAGSNTYSWNFGDGGTSTAQNPTHTYAAAGTYTASLLVTTNPGGCQNIVTQSVTVNPIPTVNAGADVAVCPGQCVNLSGSTNATGTVGPTSFSNNGTYAIPDNNTGGVLSPITVSGISPTTIGAGSIASVCLNISHAYTGDVDIFIRCPDGTQLELSTDNGGGGDNYTNTCFTPTAGGSITAGTPPFTGTYLPEGNFTTLNGCSANGTWQLFVRDDAAIISGSITGWTITFNNNIPPFTWSPTTNMTNSTTLTPNVCPTVTTTYTLTGNSGGGCVNTDQVTVTVNPPITPTFNAVGPYCSGVAIPALPTTSTNGITGTWSPAINNTATTLYTFTPTAGQCATTQTLTITITPNVTPTFAAVAPICSGAALAALPTTSTNGITGTWSPALNNTATTIYTFTPTAGQCATTTTLTITVNPNVTPTFTAVAPICSGAALAPLPTTSTNGITGTWSPALNNTATTLYTFTPTAGQCATTTTMTITVNSNVTPTFAAVGPYCSGAAVPALPTTSTNGITGTWSPAINNTNTTLYTFTPTVGQCATTTTITITINPNVTPTFTAVNPICNGAALAPLSTTSTNGITGTWSPALNNTATTTYTFTPTAGLCATTTTMNIVVNPIPVPTAVADSVNCNGGSTGSVTVSSVTASAGPYTYSWNTIPVQNTQTATGLPIGTYTVTVTDQNTLCQAQTTATLFQPVVLTATENHVNPTCAQGTNGTATANPAGGTAPYTYSWNTTPIQTTQTATGLAAGSYTCTITDYNGCTTTTTPVLVDPAGMVLNTSMTQADCGLPTGTATVSVTSGGSGNFSYSWNTAPVQNTATATGIPAGNYIATVTDVTLGCVSTAPITVTTTLGITANTVFVRDALCNGSNDGKAYAFPIGGSPVYSYSWNTTPVQTTDTLTAGAGTYTVTITDGTGCTGTANVTIGQPSAVIASITASTNETCLGANNGTATAGGVGGTGVYTYSWNTTPIQTTQTATALAPGTYTVTVRDGNLCPSTANVTINPGPMMTASHTSTNVTCFGGSNGSINVTVGGAPGAITYNWMPGSIGSEDPVGLAAGTYTLTASSMGCSVNDTVTITQPTQLIAVIDSTKDVVCNGEANGQAFASVTGGTGVYTYSWNTIPVQTIPVATDLSTGAYTLTVTDALGCQTTVNTTINEPAPLAVNLGSMPAYCGVNQGTVWAFPTNGLAPYTYGWDTATVVIGSTDTLSGLYPGTYNIQVQDANNCKFFGNTTVVAAPGGTASISNTTDVSCFGGNNGTATVSMSGAFPPYNFLWDAAASNQTTNPASNLAVGTYSVNVTDALGCIMATSATINEPTLLTTTLAQNNTVCPSSCDGSATATPSGGTAPYFYSWTDPSTQITQTAINLCQGLITVQVTDNNGCQVSQNITISNPLAMVIGDTITPANCNQPDGAAEAFVTANGQAPFSFEWSNGTTVLSTTSQLTGVPAGTYFVTVTDFNLCTETKAVTIPNLSGPQIDGTNKVDVLCFGDNTGSASVTVSGGATPYTYLWNDALAQTSPTAVNLVAGTYLVNIFDDNGCNLSTSIVVNEPTQLTLIAGGTNPTCFGYNDGQAFVNAVGGVLPYSYLWNDGVSQTNDTAFALTQGNYTITVTDGNGCIEIADVTLTDPALFTIDVSATDVSCFAGNNGTATVSENNGVTPFSYAWNDLSAQTSQTASGLIASTYNVIVTDDNGCIANGIITINEPTELILALDTSLDVTCNGLSDGYALLEVVGGTGTYNYTWHLNGTLVSTSPSPNNLAAGTYLVTVTDANGCTDQIFVTINEPSALTATNVAVDVLCAGDNSGYAFVTASGGVAPYTYQWDASAALQQTDTASNLVAGIYGVVITDDNGCNYPISGIVINEPTPLNFVSTTSSPSFCGSNNGSASVSVGGGSGTLNYEWNSVPAQFTALASNLVAGSYTVVVTDQNGCLDSTNINVIDLGAPTVTIPTFTDVSCNGAGDGTATANVTGGVTPYTYSWNTIPVQNTITATGLNAQTYSITVTDSNGCVASSSITIQQANALVAVIGTPTNVTCNGLTDGSATVMVAGGIAPFTYQWNDIASQSASTASNLGAGTYIVQVADSNNCLALDTVTITEPTIIVVGQDALTNVSCNGGSNGFIEINVTGGVFPYVNFAWTPNVSTGQTASGLTQGTYDVTVTDNNGCTATNSYTITEPSALTISLTSNPSTCGNGNGSAEVASTVGGTSPYNYSWNDPSNQQTALASNLAANTYTVIVTDNNNCSVTESIVVNNLTGPIIDSTVRTNVICFGESNGSATVFASGSGLSYLWTPSGQITQQATGLSAGVYSVTVTDINGCSSIQGGITISQPTALTADINMPATACFGQTIQLFGIGGGGTPFAAPANAYSVLWGPPFSTTTPGPLYDAVTTNTTYSIVVQDANGCTKFYNESVTVGAPLNITALDQIICQGNGSSLTATSTGGNTNNPFVYNWFVNNSGTYSTPPGVVNPTNPANVNPSTTTDYMVYVSDGCSRNDTTFVTVTVNDTTIFSVVSNNNVGCPPLVVDFKALGNLTGATISWDFDGNGTVNQTTILDSTYFIFNNSGSYDLIVSVTNQFGCTSSMYYPKHVVVNPIPVADFSTYPQIVTILNPEVEFTDLSSPDVIGWNWNFGDGQSNLIEQNPIHNYQDTGHYPVTLIVTNGSCQDTIVKYVIVKPDFFFAIPNTFTPDGDGLNDIFRPGSLVGVSEKDYNFYIFDRWGEKIWEGHDLDSGWDGTVKGGSLIAQTDTYVWLIKLKGIDGLQREYRGHVNLLK
jgi:gliding motility-associated-like protein